MKRECNICGSAYTSKQKLAEHLADHIADAEQDIDIASTQLEEELNISNPYAV